MKKWMAVVEEMKRRRQEELDEIQQEKEKLMQQQKKEREERAKKRMAEHLSETELQRLASEEDSAAMEELIAFDSAHQLLPLLLPLPPPPAAPLIAQMTHLARVVDEMKDNSEEIEEELAKLDGWMLHMKRAVEEKGLNWNSTAEVAKERKSGDVWKDRDECFQKQMMLILDDEADEQSLQRTTDEKVEVNSSSGKACHKVWDEIYKLLVETELQRQDTRFNENETALATYISSAAPAPPASTSPPPHSPAPAGTDHSLS